MIFQPLTAQDGPQLADLGAAMAFAPAPQVLGETLSAALAQGAAFGALEEVERESSLLTARSWGLEGLAALLLHRPAAETEEGLGQALAALLRIGDDSFTPEAIEADDFMTRLKQQRR